MQLNRPAILKTTTRAGIMISCVGIIIISGMGRLWDSGLQSGSQTAIAGTSYGILGQQAPELNLNTWINGDGKPIESIQLGACRGKVIYLYFFQSW